jgi:hypothetical protein
VVPLPQLYVIANYKETQLTHLQLGRRADVSVDTFPDIVLHGHVTAWSPAIGSEFALLPPDNATGDFTKVVQRVPVKIVLDDVGGVTDRLRPGMSVETTVHTDDRQDPGSSKMSSVIDRLASLVHHDAPAPPQCTQPIIAIAAVLLGSLISTQYSRVTTVAFPDLRGAVHAGFDEGAWITTAATVGQLCMGPMAAWLGLVFGPRRVRMISATVLAAAPALIPLAPDLPSLLVGQAIGGLASGTFIPLTIGFVVQGLKPSLWPYGMAAYGLNLELLLNIPASLEQQTVSNLLDLYVQAGVV